MTIIRRIRTTVSVRRGRTSGRLQRVFLGGSGGSSSAAGYGVAGYGAAPYGQ